MLRSSVVNAVERERDGVAHDFLISSGVAAAHPAFGASFAPSEEHDLPVRPEWIMQMRTAAEEFGNPVFGLLGPQVGEGVLNNHDGRPCSQMTLLYRTPDGRVEVTTGTRPLGGTDSLVRNAIVRSIPHKVRLPWSVSLEERLVMLSVDGTPTQFRVVTASTGDWLAAGGMKKRHLLLSGTPGISVEDLRLGPVALNFET